MDERVDKGSALFLDRCWVELGRCGGRMFGVDGGL